MPIFEQPRALDAETMLASVGIKLGPGEAAVILEKTDSPSDLMRQRNLYWQEGYENHKETELGLVMKTSREQVIANEKRYQQKAADRMKQPVAAGLPEKYKETAGVMERQESQTLGEFFEYAEKDAPDEDDD